MEQFLVPAGEGASEYMEKKSRFLGLITPVTTEAEARARLEAVKKQEYDARHNCWAYILHSGQKATAMTASRRARPVSRF